MLPQELADVATNRDIHKNEDASKPEDSDFDMDDISEHRSNVV